MKRYPARLFTVILMLLAVQAAADLRKEVEIWIARDVAPSAKVRMTINSTNVPTVQLAAYRLNSVEALIERREGGPRPAVSGGPVKTWTANMVRPNESKHPAQREVYRSRSVNLPQLPPGAYLIVARGGDRESWAIANVTHLAVISKRSPGHLLVWVTDAATGSPIGGAKVTVYERLAHTKKDSKGKPKTSYTYRNVVSGTTRRDGTSLVSLPAGQDETVVVSRGSDRAAVPCGITVAGRLVGHFQTDRPIYRPGQTVNYKVILRRTKGRGYVPVADTPCNIEIRDSSDNALEEKKASSNAMGTLAGQYEIPSEGALGPYSVVVKIGKESVYETFTVAEYRKPEFKVDIKPVAKRYIAGENVAFDVAASYYFDAPLPQATVQYRVRRTGTPYWAGDPGVLWLTNGSGDLYPSDTYAASDFMAEGTVLTDDKGKVTIPIKTKKDAPDSSYSIECTVTDASRREVNGSSSVPVYAAAIRIGISTDVLCAPLGSNIPVQVRVVDVDGKPAAAKVSLKIETDAWNAKKRTYQRKTLATSGVDVPPSGKATAKLPAKAQGTLYITASAVDSTGHKTRASMSVWVADPNAKIVSNKSNEPTISVKLDRKTYLPGDKIKSWVNVNTPARPVLVTAEGGDIWQYAVLPAGKSVRAWSFTAKLDMAPNTYLEAAQWVRSEVISTGATVPIPDPTRKINVRVEPNQTSYKPGDIASYTIRTSGPKNEPMPAELSVSVVDAAIYALRPDSTPDIYNTFWSVRQNAVITEYSAPEEVSGGAYQRALGNTKLLGVDLSVTPAIPARQNFMDTAYWNAQVMTGPEGVAKISFEVPGNLTTWKTNARAITADTKAGAGSASVQASRPVMLRLATPRQIVQGDRLTLIGTINNRTDQARDYDASLAVEGITIEGEAAKRVQVPAKGQATVEWVIIADKLPESGSGSITGEITPADPGTENIIDLSDAIKVNLKVVPKGVQHRIASGGVMGERKDVTLALPEDRIEPASSIRITLRAGLPEVISDRLEEVIGGGWYCATGPANDLLAISLAGPVSHAKDISEALAALYRRQKPDGGWGYWDAEDPDPEITAAVLTALARANSDALPVPKKLLDRGAKAAASLFNDENLWERAALLASSATLAGHANSGKLLASVHEKGKYLSPFAQLSLAEAYFKAEKNDWAADSIEDALQYIVSGPDTAYVPAGDHAGWSATTVETTAQALLVLARSSEQPDLQPKLVQWLALVDADVWLSQNEKMLSAYALNAYAKRHPQSTALGALDVSVNGTALGSFAPKGKTTEVTVPAKMLRGGDNTITLKRSEPGDVFYHLEARVFRPTADETPRGLRVLRRYETQDAAGLWNELRGTIKPSEPVRCSVIVWPNDRPDDIRVFEPIPSGFEFIDFDDEGEYSRNEIRDGGVVHFITSEGVPQFFRYYLRAESEGTFSALPASAEALRRPEVRGNSDAASFEVRR